MKYFDCELQRALVVLLLFLSPLGEAVAQDAKTEFVRPPLSLPTADNLDDLTLRLLPLTREELAVTVKQWQQAIKEDTLKIVQAKIAVRSAKQDEGEALRDQIARLHDERELLFEKYAIVISAWEKKGAAVEKLSEFRQYASAIVSEEVKATDPRTLLRQLITWVMSRDGGVGILIKLGILVASFMVMLTVAGIVRGITRRQIARIANISSLLKSFITTIIYWVALAVGIMFVLSLLGYNITPLFALFGGASFILAFAMQETLGNLAAGLLLMITKPFDVGDFVKTAGVSGVIENTTIVSTTIKTFDNQMIMVPNNKVWGSIITNVNVMATRRVDLVFGIGYEDDIDAAMRVLNELVQQHPLVLGEPKPNIKLHELADSSVNFICQSWVQTENYWTVYWDLTRQVKDQFDAEGISFPIPQHDVHLHGSAPVIS